MKFKYSEGDKSLDVESKVDLSIQDMISLIKSVKGEVIKTSPLNLINIEKKNETIEPVKENTNKIIEFKQTNIEQQEEDRPLIRKRLPNVTKQELNNNTLLIRCPNCGQRHCAMIDADKPGLGYLFAFDYTKGDMEAKVEYHNDLEKENLTLKEGIDKIFYYKDVQVIPNWNEDLVMTVQNDSLIYCPVCHVTNSLEDWKDAYKNPLNYFETEDLCDACGGEVTIVTKSDKTKEYKCEACGLVQPREVEE